MESKRRAFPRFYFVSTADLLDILSNGNSPHKVSHIGLGSEAPETPSCNQDAWQMVVPHRRHAALVGDVCATLLPPCISPPLAGDAAHVQVLPGH